MQKKIFKRFITTIIVLLTILSQTGCSATQSSTAKADTRQNIGSSTNETPSINSNSKENTLNQEVKIHFIDTGNSDSILIQGEKTLLIDGGDNGDENLILDYLKRNNVQSLDYMIATHPHADHIGGLDGIINSISVKQLLVANGDSDTSTYRDFINAASAKNLQPSVPLEGSEFSMGNNSKFKVFNSNGGSNSNEQSLVILFENGKDKVLLTGDAEKGTESEILDKVVDVDLLKVGHHGSRTSTSIEFLNKVTPEYAVITVGKENKYGHPHKSTMDKLKNKNIKVHRTDECGNVVFNSTGNGITTSCTEGSYNYRDSQNTNTSKDSTTNIKTNNNNTNAQLNTGVTSSKSNKTNTNKSTSKTNNSKNNSNSKKPTLNNTTPVTQTVWLSETGSKYHRINNCGRMNPNKARQVSLEEASASYGKCKNCF